MPILEASPEHSGVPQKVPQTEPTSAENFSGSQHHQNIHHWWVFHKPPAQRHLQKDLKRGHSDKDYKKGKLEGDDLLCLQSKGAD